MQRLSCIQQGCRSAGRGLAGRSRVHHRPRQPSYKPPHVRAPGCTGPPSAPPPLRLAAAQTRRLLQARGRTHPPAPPAGWARRGSIGMDGWGVVPAWRWQRKTPMPAVTSQHCCTRAARGLLSRTPSQAEPQCARLRLRLQGGAVGPAAGQRGPVVFVAVDALPGGEAQRGEACGG